MLAMRRSRLILFIVAAISLFLTGGLFAPRHSNFNFNILLYTTAVGTWFLYGMNYRVFHRNNIKASVLSLFHFNFQNFMIFHFVLIVLPLLIYSLSSFQILLLFGLVLLSWLYAFAFDFNGKRYKLKERLLIKNILIGLTWGSLTLLPCTTWHSAQWPLFAFISLQVFIGSALRDFDDIEHDRQFNIQTLPSRIGIPNSAMVLHICNIAGLIAVVSLCTEMHLKEIAGITALWRAVNILYASKENTQPFWTQTWNIATCIVIYISSLIIYLS
jgi:4-hydroxybenzoate polyprenyltransferase